MEIIIRKGICPISCSAQYLESIAGIQKILNKRVEIFYLAIWMNNHLLDWKNCHLNKVYYYLRTKATFWYLTPVLEEVLEA